jgi:hypothetical protein
LETATGRWVAFLDGDDEFLPGWRDRFAAGFAALPDADVFLCDHTRWPVGSAPAAPLHSALEVHGFPTLLSAFTRHQIGTWRELDSEKFNDLLLRSWVPFLTHNTVYRRQWLSSNARRYDPRFPISEDTDLQLRAAQGARIAFTPEILAKYRVSSSGLDARHALRSFIVHPRGRALRIVASAIGQSFTRRCHHRGPATLRLGAESPTGIR